MEKMIKVALFTYGEVEDNPLYLDGEQGQPKTIVREGLGRLGEVVDVKREYDLERGERLGAFYSDDDRKAIESGTYTGIDAPALNVARLAKAQAAAQAELVEGEGTEGAIDVATASSEEIAEHIKSNKLNVQQTVDLVGESPDVDTVNKVLDAEGIASENDPRTGVTDALEKRLSEVG
jgi:hypothetical protein